MALIGLDCFAAHRALSVYLQVFLIRCARGEDCACLRNPSFCAIIGV
jgi:hypothetical protein